MYLACVCIFVFKTMACNPVKAGNATMIGIMFKLVVYAIATLADIGHVTHYPNMAAENSRHMG